MSLNGVFAREYPTVGFICLGLRRSNLLIDHLNLSIKFIELSAGGRFGIYQPFGAVAFPDKVSLLVFVNGYVGSGGSDLFTKGAKLRFELKPLKM